MPGSIYYPLILRLGTLRSQKAWLAIICLGAVMGCSAETLAPPDHALTIESITPPNGATIAQRTGVRARLRYRLPSGTGGRIWLLMTCLDKDGRLACLDTGTLAQLTAPEGEVDVTFAVSAPGGASVRVGLSLEVDGLTMRTVKLRYYTAP